jgi:hypothetical protein
MYRLLAIALLLTLACTSRQHRVPQLAKAYALKGRTLDEVKGELGLPATQDRPSVGYWYLTEDNRYHPEPRVELYELLFEKNRLIDIKLSKH